MQFAISYNSIMRILGAITFTGPSHSQVEVSADHVEVTMGWAFSARIPRSAIRAVDQPADIPWGYGMGVHGWNGTWAVNGARTGGVRLMIDPAAPAKVLFVPVSLGTLYLSLKEPEQFVRAIRGQ